MVMRQYDLLDSGESVYTVTKLTREIRFLLEGGFNDIWVKGEISNCALSSAGHMYFSLKDKNSVLNCVLFRGNSSGIKFEMEDGLSVLCHGKISVYDKRGQYQLYVRYAEPEGKGALQLAFEQLKKKLALEGLFDGEKKKTLPFIPACLGIVTSGTGAAIKDIIKVSRRRFPGIKILLIPVRVQGDKAKQDISRAIDMFNEYNAGEGAGSIDLLIVGRGGGSLEDLWPFNEEIVARAISRSAIPVISAVGHEIDYTISDFVADMRAPTPSAAAEIAVPLKEELDERVLDCLRRMHLAVRSKTRFLEERLAYQKNSYVLKNPLNVFFQLEQRIDELVKMLTKKISHQLELRRRDIGLSAGKLNTLSPLSVLERGYSITFASGKPVRDATAFKKGQEITTRLAKGEIISIVKGVKSGEKDDI
jgi:exodeoxyribonuclease VII large subunit